MNKFLLRVFPCVLLSWTLISSCSEKPKAITTTVRDSIPQKDASIKGSFTDQRTLHFDSLSIDTILNKFPLLSKYRSDVKQFYAGRQYSYAWFNEGGLIEQANNLNNHLNDLAADGIQVEAPYVKAMDSLLHDPAEIKSANPKLDILMTAEYLFYADKVWNGISVSETNKLQWYLPRKKLNLPYIMDSVLKDSTASLFSPGFSIRQYNILKQALQTYRHIDSTAHWKTLSAAAKTYQTGDSDSLIAEIRHRLFLFGDINKDDSSPHFDSVLLAGVKSFQDRSGMATNGVIGASFMKAINAPLSTYIEKIIINLERMRWIPTNIGNHFLLINIPAFSLYAYDDDTVTFRMNVVVGKDMHKTVIFSGNLQYIVFSPYWNVPPSILKSEVLPAIKRDPNYLKRNNMEWNGNGVRQKPGPKNSLGLVKFLFPNTYNIYLHDSPAKGLFNEPSRAFSHGCIRLAEPEKLADYLLKADPAWNVQTIHQAMNAGKEKYVTLKQTVPVYIGYFTAYGDDQGRIHFLNDVYQRDQILEKMLIQP